MEKGLQPDSKYLLVKLILQISQLPKVGYNFVTCMRNLRHFATSTPSRRTPFPVPPRKGNFSGNDVMQSDGIQNSPGILIEEDRRDPTKKETWHFGIAIFKNDVKHVRAHLQNPKEANGWDVSWLANIVQEADARPFVTVCSREKV